MSRERKIDMVILGLFNHEDHMYYYLTVTFGIDTYEAYLK